MRVASILHCLSLRVLSIAIFVSLALLTSTQALYAGTITIVDGTGTNTGPDVFDDAYIEAQLATGDYTIDTTNATGAA